MGQTRSEYNRRVGMTLENDEPGNALVTKEITLTSIRVIDKLLQAVTLRADVATRSAQH